MFLSRYWVVALLVSSAFAKDFDICGTWVGRTQQEMFLHRRNLLEMARQPQIFGRAPGTAAYAQDFGNVAVMDDAGGVVARRNTFNLDRRTVAFVPATGGYRVELSEDTFDLAASQGSPKLEGFGDDDSRRVPLPFAFRFFGTEYRELWINSNGTLTFGRGDTDYSGTYGHFVSGPPAIAALFADLDPEASTAGVRFQSDGTKAVVTWSGVPLTNGSLRHTFQIRIYATGRIELAYSSAAPQEALAGITPGGFSDVELVSFTSGPSKTFGSGVAEFFTGQEGIDIAFAAQRFYQTHDDAYDYLVIYNSAGVRAAPGSVAYEATVRSAGEGYGDTPVNDGLGFGSKRRLLAVMNMGPLSQYPLNPNGVVAARGPIGDTPLTLLAHEAGHLALALVSVADPAGAANSTPMLTSDRAHWSFAFNSDASVMGGNRISDRGETVPRFLTTATSEGYSPLDQYLMGMRGLEEVPSTFVVLNSGIGGRFPEKGVEFNGNRLEVRAGDIAARYGRRTPDATVAQRRFRFGFIVVVPAGALSSEIANAVGQVEQYRKEFEGFFAKATGNRAAAETTLKRGVTLSLAPAAGLLVNSQGTGSLEIAAAVADPLIFTVRGAVGIATPVRVGLLPGQTRASFPIFGARRGVEELTLVSSNDSYESPEARVQISALEDLRVAVSGTQVRVEDRNRLPYARIPVEIRVRGAVGGGSATSADDGSIQLPTAAGGTISASLAGVSDAPDIDPGGVVDAFTYRANLAPGGYVSIFGHGLTNAVLRLNGRLIRTLYTSDRQVNFLAPANLSPGAVTVTLDTSRGVALATVVFAAP